MHIGRQSMLRAKILKIESSISAKEAKNFLLKAEYVDEVGRGIVLSNTTNSEISGKYYEKNIYIEEIIHPINGLTELERYNFSDVAFNIDFELGLITLYSNIVRKNSFITFLGMCLDFKVSIIDIKINPIRLIEDIKSDIHNINIRKLVYSNIQIDNNTKVSIAINSIDDASKNSNFLSVIANQIPSRLNFEGSYNNKRISCSVSLNCSISISNNFSEEILSIIQSNISSAILDK
jgi:hypothetical protein